jgi:hypothetical protein
LARALNEQIISAEYANKIYSPFNIFGYVIGIRWFVIPALERNCIFGFEGVIYIDLTSCACDVSGETRQY